LDIRAEAMRSHTHSIFKRVPSLESRVTKGVLNSQSQRDCTQAMRSVAGLSFKAFGDIFQRGVIAQRSRVLLLVSAGLSIVNPELKLH
jgi:hypothetical protein